MTIEQELREKLKKLEALFSDAGTIGEQQAASAAKERIIKKLKQGQSTEQQIEMRFHLKDMWSRKLFIALCRRYELKPYRYSGQKYTTVVVKAPETFINNVLWAEYQEIQKILYQYLEEATNRIIKQEIYSSIEEVEIIEEKRQLRSYI